MRKITWRALLEDVLQKPQDETDDGQLGLKASNDDTTEIQRNRQKRLGKLNDQAFANWETFIRVVQGKLRCQLADFPEPSCRAERRIEVLHMLRCIVGPVVESYILLDRFAWILEELKVCPLSATRMRELIGVQNTPTVVELVNLFDQASGSGRNVAIVIHPFPAPIVGRP